MSPLLRFELMLQLRRPTFWVVSLLHGGFGLADVLAKAGQGQAFFFVNSPAEILQTAVWYSLFAVLAATAFVADALARDARVGIEPLVLATPASRWQLVGVRFWAAFVVAALACACYLPGMLLGSLMPGLNPYAIGPLRLDAYLASWLVFALPNLFIVSVFAFCLASRSRSQVAPMAGAVVLVMLRVTMLVVVDVGTLDDQGQQLWSLLDPFGHNALETGRLAWSLYQHNHQMPALDGLVLHNRLLWLGLAALALAWGYRVTALRPSPATGRPVAGWLRRWRWQRPPTTASAAPAAAVPAAAGPAAAPLRPRHGVRSVWRLMVFELRLMLGARSFQIMSLCGLVSLFHAAAGSKAFEHAQPSMDILVHAAGLYFRQVLLAIVVVQAAQMRWRDADARLQPVIDASPAPAWLPLAAQFGALAAMVLAQLLAGLLVLGLYQRVQGWTQHDWALGLQMLWCVQAPFYLFVGAASLALHAWLRQRWAAMAATVALAASPVVLDALGLFHNLYRFGRSNDLGWSPMNGWAGLLPGHAWYVAYWSVWSLGLLTWAAMVAPRGQAVARRRAWALASRGQRTLLAGCGLVVMGLGGWIAYNTTVLNPYQPPGRERMGVEHEQRFKQHEALPMPVVVGTLARIDIHPAQRQLRVRGHYTLENRSGQTIHEVHLSTYLGLQLVHASLPGSQLVQSQPEWGYHIHRLHTPLAPGARTRLDFETRTAVPPGFRNHVDSDDVAMVAPNEVLANGSSLYGPFILPFVGYTRLAEHKQAWMRARHGLPPLATRLRPHDDPQGRAQALLTSHLAWGPTELVVSTDGDQQVVGPGRVLRRWQEGGRNWVHLQSVPPARGRFTLYSARFARQQFQADGVPVEVWHHPAHADNARRMGQVLVQAVQHYRRWFGPMPYDSLRLAEFAYYPGMVFSEAGTLALPEVIAWKSDLRPGGDGEDAMIGWLGYLLGFTWFDDPLIAADVAGGMVIRDALSGYAANLLRRSLYSPERWQRTKQAQMRQFFRAVGRADTDEPPLEQVYNEVTVARLKGQMVLEQIESMIGQAALLAAINDFSRRWHQQPPPYPTVLDLRDAILGQTPPPWQAAVRELFNQVVTYRLAVDAARAWPLADGRWQLEVRIDARKLLGGGLQATQAQAFDMPLTVQALDSAGQVLGSWQLPAGANAAPQRWQLPQAPASVALDPAHVLPAVSVGQHRRAVQRLTAAPA